MGDNSKIEWTHHTFNPWVGCQRVSEECRNCYAESWAKRTGLVKWGPGEERRVTSVAYWRKPLKWNQQAAKEDENRRVFCASLADVFEHRPDLEAPRSWLWSLVEHTKHLDWLLLTKRPENVEDMVPQTWLQSWPRNAWLGTTCGHPDTKHRVETLLRIDAHIPIRFVSAEPLLGDLGEITTKWLWPLCRADADEHRSEHGDDKWCFETCIDWVIVGAESGSRARPCEPDWVRSIRNQCCAVGAAFFLKQLNQGGRLASLPELDGKRWAEIPHWRR